MIPANFDFDRVTERSKADEFNRSADEQTHFEKASTIFGRNFDFGNGGGAADCEGGQRLALIGHSLRPALSSDRLDENVVRQFGADPEAGVADQTNKVRMPAQKLDALLLAKPQLAQANRDFRRGIETPDAHGSARHNPAQWTDIRVRANRFRANWTLFSHVKRRYCN
jgi:hypothetical protein